jgi:hypothetical protein
VGGGASMIRLISIWKGRAVWTDYADLCSAIYTFETITGLDRQCGVAYPELYLVYAESGVDVAS